MPLNTKLLLMTMIVFMGACSTGGQTLPSGVICPANYNPVLVDPTPGLEGLSLAPKGNSALVLPPGNYVYNRADLYFVQNAPTNGVPPLQLELHDATDGIGDSVKQYISCLAGVSAAGITGIAGQTDGVTDITVRTADLSQIVKSRHFAFSVVDTVFNFGAPTVTTGSPFASPTDAYAAAPGDTNGVITKTAFYKLPTGEYFISSQVIVPTGTFNLGVYMDYVPCPVGGCL